MHDLRWERWLDELARVYFVAAYRPELPVAERLRAAREAEETIDALRGGGPAAHAYVVGELSASDTQRRNAAARALSCFASAEHVGVLVSCYLDESRQWLSPTHLVRAGRRVSLDPRLAAKIPDVGLRVQPALVQALLSEEHPAGRRLLDRLVVGPDPTLAEAAVEAVARWQVPELLWQVLRRADGTDNPPVALIPAALQAALVLAQRGERRALDWLEERTLDEDPAIAGLAHASLGGLGWPGCLVELADHLEEADGMALAYGLEAAESQGSPVLLPSLVEVVRRLADASGPGLDDNPADHAIRVLERITGRWVPPALCDYDRHGNFDAATRRRAALLYASLMGELDPAVRLRGGEVLDETHLVHDLLSPSTHRRRAAAIQLEARTGVDHGYDPREDLVANREAVLAWRKEVTDRPPAQAGGYAWRRTALVAPIF